MTSLWVLRVHGIVTGGSEHEVDVAVDVLPIFTP